MTSTTIRTTPSPSSASRTSGRRTTALGLAVLTGVVAACGGSDDASPPEASAPAPASTSADAGPSDESAEEVGAILPDGTHVGVAWFAPPFPGTEEIVFERWEQANADATVGRVLIDWIDVEPERGGYEFGDLEEQLAAISERGARPMVTIAAVDLSGTEFPEWLGGFEPASAAAAYAEMLEAAAPVLERHDVFLVAVANEPPLEDGLDVGEFADFVAAVETEADMIIPDIPVTFVFAGGDALKRDAETVRLASSVDVFSANHYCLGADLLTIDLADTAGYLAESIELAGDKPIVLQEFGCPASEALGSSEEFQAAWFEEAFDVIRADDQVIAAFVFEFGNWSDELVELDYGEAIAAEPELDWFFERLAEWVKTSGLIRPDGSTRPAWDVYLANLGG